jgi:hypothetical protein
LDREMVSLPVGFGIGRRLGLPTAAGLIGSALMALVYFGLVSWAESPKHALDLFWEDKWIVLPILVGFGIQVGLDTVLKKGLYLPVSSSGPSGGLVGAGGGTSTLAMAACCAHHAADVLPLVGLSAAAAFLAEYKTAFMLLGLGTNLVGIGVMVRMIVKRREAHAKT